MPIIPSSAFTWTGRLGVVEASDLAADGFETAPSLKVVSTKTGKTQTFFQTVGLLNRENEFEAWIFKTLDGKFELRVLND